MAPNHEYLFIQNQPRNVHFRFNSKPVVPTGSRFVERKPIPAAFTKFHNRSRFPEYFEDIVSNPTSGQSFHFKKTVRNDSKMNDQLLNKHVFKVTKRSEVQQVTKINLNFTVPPPPLPNLSVPPPNYAFKPCQRSQGRMITKKPEPFYPRSVRSIHKDTSKKVDRMGTWYQFDKFSQRKVQQLPKSKQTYKEMRFLPTNAKIPERYTYDVIRAPWY